MQFKKINPIISWWVTPLLPYEDVFAKHNFFSQWLAHPIKRRFAKWYLKFLQKYTKIKVIAVTGSAGKTTTIQMLSSILKLDGKTISPKPSVDSVYNIPNTILKTPIGTKYLILEMSVEYIGEMDFYLWLAKPDIGLVTNVFPTHTLFFGDTEGVYKEKSKLVKNLNKNGYAVLNKNNEYTKRMSNLTKAKVTWFLGGADSESSNRESAVAVAKLLNIDQEKIKKGLQSYIKPDHRNNVFRGKNGVLVFDDTYNSNPEALLSAIQSFVRMTKGKKRVAVLGDMLELGKIEITEHKRVGKKINKLGFDAVIGVGELSKYMLKELDTKKTKVFWVESSGSASKILASFVDKKYALFMKGSRSIGLDKLVDKLV